MELDDIIPWTNFSYEDLIIAIIIAVAGYFVARFLATIIKSVFLRSNMPELLADKLSMFAKYLLYVIVLFMVLSALNFDTGPTIIALGAVIGLVLGFGLQDTMNNILAGVWIAVIQPFGKGDYVDLSGQSGTVREVAMLSTVVHTPDNVYITIPNGQVWGTAIRNYSRMDIRRVDVSVGVSYSGDLDRAVSLAMGLMEGHSNILGEPAPAVVVTDLGDSSVNLALRAWCWNADYWDVRGALTKGILELFTEEGVEIPFPQMDVHLDQ